MVNNERVITCVGLLGTLSKGASTTGGSIILSDTLIALSVDKTYSGGHVKEHD